MNALELDAADRPPVGAGCLELLCSLHCCWRLQLSLWHLLQAAVSCWTLAFEHGCPSCPSFRP